MELDIEQLKRSSAELDESMPSSRFLRDVSSSDLLSEIAAKFESNEAMRRYIEEHITGHLLNLKTAVGVLSVSRSTSVVEKERDAAIQAQLTDMDSRIESLLTQVGAILSVDMLYELEEMSVSFQRDNGKVHKLLDEIQSTYNDMCRIRSMVQEACDTEAVVRRRVASELEALTGTATRISGELVYIKEEREKLRFKLMSEFPAPPLMDVLDATESGGAGSWLKGQDRGLCEATYN